MQEDADTVKAYQREMRLSFPLLLDTTGEVSQLYGVRATPTHFLVSIAGRVMAANVGAKDWSSDAIRSLVEMLHTTR
jgi:peroxiredoxin